MKAHAGPLLCASHGFTDLMFQQAYGTIINDSPFLQMRKPGCREISSALLRRVVEIFGCSWRWRKKRDLSFPFNTRYLSLFVCWWEQSLSWGYEKGYNCRSGDTSALRGARTCLHWRAGRLGSCLLMASIFTINYGVGSSARGVEAKGGL